MVPPSNRAVMQGQNHNVLQSYTRDCDFFFKVKPLYLRAENTLFCVPRYYFQTSDVFDGMFTLTSIMNTPEEGSSDAHPLFLETIKAKELKDFLRVLCHRFMTTDPEDASGPHVPTSWVPVLKLASLWQITSLREKALQHLKSADCFLRLELLRQHYVKDWFLPELRDLIQRSQPLTVDEITRLGLDFAVKVIILREKALSLWNTTQVQRRLALYFYHSARFSEMQQPVVLAHPPPPYCVISDDEIRRTFE
uniref:Uncharacterized protein n=1 Tax=Ganoderma boninense TaxID=34458 RepID=A0A5K1K921_9APHY|nr:Uncharacterized protein [Ganoderma boninense]